MNTYTAEQTGEYPTLCHGEWKLYRNGEDISSFIPEELRFSPMNCAGFYEEWEFDEHYQEIWNTYYDGFSMPHWIKENEYWLKNIGSEIDYPLIFEAFLEDDWRGGSCGGCI